MGDKTFEFFLSGGVGNSDPNASLGGTQSTTELFGQTVTYDTTPISGVTLLDSSGLVTGILIYTNTGSFIGIQETGGAVPTGDELVDISVDGDYVLNSPEENITLSITVVSASLPGSNDSKAITAANNNNNLWDDVPESEAQTGIVAYRHFYIENLKNETVTATLFIKQPLTGMDYIEVGVLSLTSGTDDELLVDEFTAPTGITFYLASTIASGLELQIFALDSIGVFVRRTVPALSDVTTPTDAAVIALELI